MNRKRIKQCITMLKNAKNFDIQTFQDSANGGVCFNANSVEELHRCGNTACFAGYLAISDFFKKDGGEISYQAPLFGNRVGCEAVAVYLDIPSELACSLVYGDLDNDDDDFSSFYQRFWPLVEASDVIEKLEEILASDDSVVYCELVEESCL